MISCLLFPVSCFLFFFSGAALAQDEPPPAAPAAPTVTIRADRSKVPLGEPFIVYLTVIHAPDVSVNLPAALPLGEAFAEFSRKEDTTILADGLHKKTVALSIAAFEIGKQTFPPVPVIYVEAGQTGQVLSEGLVVEVLSVVGDGREELKPIAPPVAVVQPDWRPLWIGGAVLLVLATAFVTWKISQRYRSRPRVATARQAAAAMRSSHEVALEKLRALRTSGALDAEDRRPFYFAVSEIMREYLGRRFQFDALELTTSELLAALDKAAGPLPMRDRVSAWLEDSDLVKYARIEASPEDANRSLDEAIALVESTAHAVVVPPAPPSPEPAPPAPPPPAAESPSG